MAVTAGKNIRAKNARAGDTVNLLPGSSLSWLADAVGEMSYEDLKEKWGLIDKNPTGETKNVICLADLSDTATAPGTPMSGIMETDASSIPEEQINCIWIPIPDNLTISMKQASATRQLGPDRDAGFIGLLRKGVGKLFGRDKEKDSGFDFLGYDREEEPEEQPKQEPEFAPTQIVGLPVSVPYGQETGAFETRTTYHKQRDEDGEAIPLGGMSLAVADTNLPVPDTDYTGYQDDQDDVDSVIEGQFRVLDDEDSEPIVGSPGATVPAVVEGQGFHHWSSEEEDDDPSSAEDPDQELIEEGQPGPKSKKGIKFTFSPGPTYYLTAEGLQVLLVQPYEAGEFGKDIYDKGIRLASKPIKRRDALNSGIDPEVFEAQIEEGYWSTNPEDFFISESNTALALRDPDKESFWDSTRRKTQGLDKKAEEVSVKVLDTAAGGVGRAVGFASKFKSPLARLGGAALTGFHAGAGAALSKTAVGKFLNIETQRLTLLSRVPVGETVMFTVGDDRVGVRRGDRGEVRMGSRGKAKVVYFPDTGEIVQPDQWTMVAITGKAPTPQTGTIGMGLDRFGSVGRHGLGSGWRPDKYSSNGDVDYDGELPQDFIDLMMAIPVSHNSEADERQRQLIAKQFGLGHLLKLGPHSGKRKELYARIRRQANQAIILRGQDAGPVKVKGPGQKIKFIIEKRGPEGDEHGDPGSFYIRTVIPFDRIPGIGVAPRGWDVAKSKATLYSEDESRDKLTRWVELINKQPLGHKTTQEHDVDPYITHTGQESYGEASDPESEGLDDIAKHTLFVEARRKAKEAGMEDAEARKAAAADVDMEIWKLDFGGASGGGKDYLTNRE